MHPNLIALGPFTIRAYGTMIVIGFFAGLLLARLRIQRTVLKMDQVFDLSFYLLAGGIIGAKLLFIAVFWKYFLRELALLTSSPMEFVKSLGTGFVFYGCVIAGVIVLVVYSRYYKLPAMAIGDFLAPSLALGHAFGRIGCFLAGCCYGKACDLPWAITFTHPDTLAPPNIPLHPAQLYESLFLFLLTGIMVLLEQKLRYKPGMILSIYIFSYSAWRLFIEQLRGDPRGSVFNDMMTSTQLIAVIGILFAIALFTWSLRRVKTLRR